MTTTRAPDELERIGAADELEIAITRRDGTLSGWVPIWVVRVGEEVYVRSWRGRRGSWFRHASDCHRARIRVPGTERDVTVEEPGGDGTAELHAAIDAAYRTKYARHASTYVDPNGAAHAAAATLRLRPLRTSADRSTAVTENREPSGAQQMFGDFAPALVGYTDDVLFGQVWTRTNLSPKERSLVTVAALTTSGNTDQLVYHLALARDNGASEDELIEAITHLAFYAGWPKAMAAMAVAKQVFRGA